MLVPSHWIISPKAFSETTALDSKSLFIARVVCTLTAMRVKSGILKLAPARESQGDAADAGRTKLVKVAESRWTV
jgi:hypothetical protein